MKLELKNGFSTTKYTKYTKGIMEGFLSGESGEKNETGFISPFP